MSSFFSRVKAKFKGSSGEDGEDGVATASNERKEGFVLNFPTGQIAFTPAEGDVFTKLALLLDVAGDDSIGGRHGAMFLRRSGLSKDQLRDLWKLACGGKSKATLSRDNWFVACKLVALAQSTGTVSIDPLLGNEVLPFPNFKINLDVPPLPTPLMLNPIGQDQLSISVTSPTAVGQGMRSYTAYKVSTVTTFEYFPRKEMTVMRRFSDFLWLHDMLCSQYAGALIPQPPDKKSIGNMDQEFIAARCKELNDYMCAVASHPLLCRSFPLRVFLDTTTEGLAAFKDLIVTEYAGGAPPGSASGNGVLSSLWNKVSSTAAGGAVVEIPSDEQFAKLKLAHTSSFSQLSQALREAQRYFQSRRDCAYQVSRLGSYLSELSQYERRTDNAGASAFAERRRRDGEAEAEAELGNATAGAGAGAQDASPFAGAGAGSGGQWAGTAFDGAVAPDDDDVRWGPSFVSNEDATKALFEEDNSAMFAQPVIRRAQVVTPKKPSRYARVERKPTEPANVTSATQLFGNFGAAVESVSNLLQDQLDVLQTMFVTPMVSQVEVAQAVNSALSRRDDTIGNLQGAHNDLAAKKRSYAAARANAKGAASAEAAMARAEKKIEQAEKKLETVTKTLKAQMADYNRQRRAKMGEMLATLARTEARNCRERNTRWQELLDSTTSDDSKFAASKHRIAGHTLIDHAAIAAAVEEARTRERETLDPAAFL